jgi:hypothetical protein
MLFSTVWYAQIERGSKQNKTKQNQINEYKNQEMRVASEIELRYFHFTFGKRGMILVDPWIGECPCSLLGSVVGSG